MGYLLLPATFSNLIARSSYEQVDGWLEEEPLS